MNRNIKKVIYYVFLFGGMILLSRFGGFNILSYAYGVISVYLGRWCYNAKI